MTNAYYNHADGVPAAQTRGTSAAIRAEFDLVAAAFSLLPVSAYAVDTGAVDALAVAINANVTSYTDGLVVMAKIANTSTVAAPTLNANGIGAVAIVRNDGSAMTAGDLAAGTVAMFSYNAATARWHYLLGLSLPNLTVTGTVNVPTRPENDNSANAASTAYVDASLAAAAAAGAAGQLPNQAAHAGGLLWTNAAAAAWTGGGAAGQVLVSSGGGAPVWATQTGIGGATVNAGTTVLLASSPAAQAIAATDYGQYVVLPDATTCMAGSNLFGMVNTGDYPLGIKDGAGNQLGWMAPRKAASIGLADNATVAGVWVIPGLQNMAVTASTTAVAAYWGGICQRLAVDANRTLFMFWKSGVLYGIMYDAALLQWGAVTILSAAIAAPAWGAILSGSGQVLLCHGNDTATLYAFTLTLGGATTTAIAVNTVYTAALAAATSGPLSAWSIVAVGNAFVCGFATTADNLLAITVNGTAITFGAPIVVNAAAAGQHQLYVASPAVVLSCSQIVSNGGVRLTPVSLDGGLALTTGTAVVVAGAGNSSFRSGIVGSNWWLFTTDANGYLRCAIITLTGTVVTASTIGDVSGAGVAVNYATAYADAIVVGNAVLAVYMNSTGAAWCNIVTNTAGTASIGTQAFLGAFANPSWVACLSASGTTARVVAAGYAGASPAFVVSAVYAGIAMSAASPVVTMLDAVSGLSPNLLPSLSGVQPNVPGSNITSTSPRAAGLMFNGSAWYSLPVSPQIASVPGSLALSGDATQMYLDNCATAAERSMAIKSVPIVAGANGNETWAKYNLGPGALQRIECAA